MPSQIALMGILSAVIFNILLGIIWYSPNILGGLWLRSYKFSRSVLTKPNIDQFIRTIIVSIVMSFVVWIFIATLNVHDTLHAIKTGILLWLGFIATTEYSAVIWEKKPISGYLIDAGYWLVSLIVVCPIIAHWH